MRLFSLPAAIVVLCVLSVSCSDDYYRGVAQETNLINFSGRVAENPAKGSEKRSMPAVSVESMGCMAYTAGKFYIRDERYDRGADGQYTCLNQYYWPGNHLVLDFYNYAPYGAEGVTLPDSPSAPRRLVYEAPARAPQQPDLMVAVNRGIAGDRNSPVSLTFKHILTAVTVVASDDQQDPVVVESVTFKDIRNSGSYDMDTGQWILTGETADYSFSGFDATDGSNQLVGGENTLMLPPQSFGDGKAFIEIEVVRAGGLRQTLSFPLDGEWEMGKKVVYSVSAKRLLRFDQAPAQVDAHYVIATMKLVSDLDADVPWTVYASAGDGASVSVQLEDEVNPLCRDDGYWLDREFDASGRDIGSARGSATLSAKGPGTFTLYIFVPENTSGVDRTVTLQVKSEGASAETSFIQVPSADGWERIDDRQQAEYGFLWDRVAVYVFPYNVGSLGQQYTKAQATQIWNDIVERYNASSIAEGPFEYRDGLGRRLYFKIDYTKLNSLGGMDATAGGLENTLALYRLGGSAATGTFENAVANTRKTESGHTGEPLFRWRSSSDPAAVPQPVGQPWSSGIELFSNNGLSVVLKRNRYNLVTTASAIGSTKAPKITEDDILWYWPAAWEYSSAPSQISSWLDPAGSWSSTPAASPRALLGDNSAADRNSLHFIRVKRR